MNSVHFKSQSNEWATPQDLFDELDREFHFTLDPCATEGNHKCERYFTREEDGLTQTWYGERVFMNPPYGRQIGLWVAKAYTESVKGALVVCLIPSRTDTRYWHDYVMKADEIRFIEGRLRFVGKASESAPFPSAIVIFQPKVAWKSSGMPRVLSARGKRKPGVQLTLG